jgi:hypothetical protein
MDKKGILIRAGFFIQKQHTVKRKNNNQSSDIKGVERSMKKNPAARTFEDYLHAVIRIHIDYDSRKGRKRMPIVFGDRRKYPVFFDRLHEQVKTEDENSQSNNTKK